MSGNPGSPPRAGVLLGPWQFVTLLLVAPWLLIAVPGVELGLGERWQMLGLGGVPIVILLVVISRNLVFVSQRGLWIAGRGWTPWQAVVWVKIEEIDECVLPIEAPVLHLDVPIRHRGRLGSAIS